MEKEKTGFEKFSLKTPDLNEIVKKEIAELKASLKWKYVKKHNVLVYDGYEIDLCECKTVEQFMDWICHLNGKSWVTSELLGDFIRAVDLRKDIRSMWAREQGTARGATAERDRLREPK
jgi:hypothetical protein